MLSKTKQFGTLRREFSWRHGNPETDVDLDGQPVLNNYSIIVRVKDCPTIRESESGRVKYINTKNAPQAIIMNHGAAHYGYGEWKQVQSKNRKYIVDKQKPENSAFVNVFYRCIVYTVHCDRVYTRSIYRIEMPDSLRERSTRNVLIEKI